MSKAKRQHWVPRFYLKEFAINKDRKESQVWIFSNTEGDPQRVNVKDIAVKKYLYSPEDINKNRDWYMEDKLASLESLVSQIWTTFANGYIDLDNESNRKIISLFMATLFLRHPQRISEYQDFQDNFIDFCKTLPKDAEGRPKVTHFVIKEKEFELDTSNWDEYSNPTPYDRQKLFIDYIEKMAIDLANILMKKRWSIIISETKQFITSDNPIIITNNISNKIEILGFDKKGTSITFPISPTRVLILDDLHKEPSSQYYPVKKGTVEAINSLSWKNSHQFMITHKNPDEILYEIFEGKIYG